MTQAAGQRERNVTERIEAAVEQQVATELEDRLPEILDQVLGRLSEVGVQGILKLAEAMVEARGAASPTAHLVPSAAERN